MTAEIRQRRIAGSASSRSSLSSSSSSSLNHLDDSTQRPFPASSDRLGNLVRSEAIRMRDIEMNIDRINERRAHEMRTSSNVAWDDVDGILNSIGLLGNNAKQYSDNAQSLWWPSSPLTSSDDIIEKDPSSSFRSPLTEQQQTMHTGRTRIQRTADMPQPMIKQDRSGLLSHAFNFAEHSQRGHQVYAPMEGPNDEIPPIYPVPDASEDALALLLPLLVLLSTLLFLLLIFIVLVIFVRRRARIALTDGDGPLDVGREEELEGLGGLDGVEERWLETVDSATRRGYARAKDWILSFPAGSQSSEITLSQFLSIQEKGVSAWSFDPDYENNPSVFVGARTEIAFMADGEGMAPQEGGGCSVQSNLPLPKLNEVYYWEAKMFTKPDTTNVAVGLATKPYPGFRMPGWSKYSVGYFSADGFKCHNYPFAAQSYGPTFVQGDVIGVGYRPRSGTVFFTRNGKRLEDAFVGLNRYNLFPTIGADGAAEVHVNLGQAGFVFIEANVKKWGLAPMVGTLAPPPPYGMERGSILIEAGQGTSSNEQQGRTGGQIVNHANLRPPPRNVTPPPPLTPPSEEQEPGISSSSSLSRRARARRARRAAHAPSNDADGNGRHSSDSGRDGHDPQPHPSSPQSTHEGLSISPPLRRASLSSSVGDEAHNPPTPHHLDISLHSLDGAGTGTGSPPTSLQSDSVPSTLRGLRATMNAASYFPNMMHSGRSATSRTPSPPPYTESRHVWPSASSVTEYNTMQNQARRTSGRTHSLANALFGALADRGLLTPLSAHDSAASSNQRSAVGNSPTHSFEQHVSRADPSANDATSSQNQNPSSGWMSSWFR